MRRLLSVSAFTNRPVLAIVVSALLLLLGVQGASQLEVRQYPRLEKTQITVRTAGL